MNKREAINYKGEWYYRYPDSPNWADKCYFRCRPDKLERYLHRQIWIDNFGDIPDGYDIHHKDLNPLNNDISNLDCLPQSEHNHKHPITEVRLKLLREHLNRIRSLTVDWHGTPEGLEWHRQHGIDAYKNRQPLQKICAQCGNAFSDLTRQSTTRFCSNKCKSKWRRLSGRDDETRTCVICQTSFVINKYSDTKTCSKICDGKLISRTKSSVSLRVCD